MKKLFKAVLVLAFVGLVAAAVASYVSKKKLESMSDEEIRDFLARKLEGKVGDEQLETIQSSVIAGVRKTRAATESVEAAADDVVEAAGDAADATADAAGDAVDAAADIASDAKDSVKKAGNDVADAVKNATKK
jgi:hypothetical protein